MNERRIYDDEAAFADRATWLDYHGIKQDRRKQRNILTENNHEEACLLFAAGQCTCQEEG